MFSLAAIKLQRRVAIFTPFHAQFEWDILIQQTIYYDDDDDYYYTTTYYSYFFQLILG